HRARGTRESTRKQRQAVYEAGGHRGRQPGSLLARRLFAYRKKNKMKAIADTGFLVAYGNRRDRHHDWARQLATRVTEPLLTCEAVVAEVAFHLENAGATLAMLHTGLVKIALAMGEEQERLSELAERYADRSPDLADLCIVRLSEMFPKHSVITVDV